jgi:hypothetical protein
MKNILLCTIICLLLNSCRKEKHSREPDKKKSVVELLTQKKWILTGYGFDDNHNMLIDESENMIQECQKDNSYEFFTGGSGVVKENEQVCNAGAPFTDFQWKLSDDNKELFISFNPAKIARLDESSMVLRHYVPGLIDSLTTVYKH